MDCPISTYSFIERLTECGLYGFSLTQVLLLVGLGIVGAAYAVWEHRKQVRTLWHILLVHLRKQLLQQQCSSSKPSQPQSLTLLLIF